MPECRNSMTLDQCHYDNEDSKYARIPYTILMTTNPFNEPITIPALTATNVTSYLYTTQFKSPSEWCPAAETGFVLQEKNTNNSRSGTMTEQWQNLYTVENCMKELKQKADKRINPTQGPVGENSAEDINSQ